MNRASVFSYAAIQLFPTGARGDRVARRTRRFDDTTEHLRDAAATVLVTRGVRAVTLELLAEHGYASVGSVYERWSSRAALLDDVVRTRCDPLWSDIERDPSASLVARLATLMDSTEGEAVGTFLVELLHLARDLPELAHHAHRGVQRLLQWCAVEVGAPSGEPAERGTRWWLAATVVGHAQLRLGGAQMPQLAPSMAHLASPPSRARQSATVLDVPTSDLPRTQMPDLDYLDIMGAQLVGITRDLMGDKGGEPGIRDVLDLAGVAAGTLYRRFSSKRALLEQVLRHELRTASYDWVQGMLDAVSSDDPVGALARVFRLRFENLTSDAAARQVILELTVQARTDEALRQTVIAQVEHVAGIRAAFFHRFADAGVLAEGLSPEACGWLVQCPAAGYRLLVGAGLGVDADELEAALGRVFWNVIAP